MIANLEGVKTLIGFTIIIISQSIEHFWLVAELLSRKGSAASSSTREVLIFDWCEKKLRSFDPILPGASATGKITNVAGAEGGG